MDKNKYSFIWESIRFVFAISVITLTGNWFGIDALIPYGTYIVAGYLATSLLVSIYFVASEFKTQNQPILNT
jgi:hypothetical protein